MRRLRSLCDLQADNVPDLLSSVIGVTDPRTPSGSVSLSISVSMPGVQPLSVAEICVGVSHIVVRHDVPGDDGSVVNCIIDSFLSAHADHVSDRKDGLFDLGGLPLDRSAFVAVKACYAVRNGLDHLQGPVCCCGAVRAVVSCRQCLGKCG